MEERQRGEGWGVERWASERGGVEGGYSRGVVGDDGEEC